MKYRKPKLKIDNKKIIRLVEKAKSGNKKALEQIIDEVSGYIYFYSLTILGNDDKAQDATQDILLTILRKINTVEAPNAFLGWVKTVTANYCKTKLSRGRESLSLEENEIDLENSSEQINPAKRAETREVCAIINKAVKELPVLQRECVLMYYYEQLSVKEISEILNVSENTVKSRLRYARKSIREHLEKSGNGNLLVGGVSPLALISHSLINAAENQEGLVIPYKAPSGKIMVTTVKCAPAAVSLSTKAAAIGCVGIVALSGISVFAWTNGATPLNKAAESTSLDKGNIENASNASFN